MQAVNVVSLFDGMSCGMLALKGASIPVETYKASEIDPFAEKVSKTHYPSIQRLGNVTDVGVHKADLLIGGSPCQSFSTAGNNLGFKGKSGLFYEYLRVLNSGDFKHFLLENVVMKQEWQDIITAELGVKPVKIDSSLFSAQTRRRLYWTNIPLTPLPAKPHPQMLEDILETNVDQCYYLSDKTVARIKRSRTGGRILSQTNIKAATVIAGYGKIPSDCQYLEDDRGVRRLTPLEFERLQGVPEGYTDSVSDTQRYKMLGNGWNVPTISHIFRGLK